MTLTHSDPALTLPSGWGDSEVACVGVYDWAKVTDRDGNVLSTHAAAPDAALQQCQLTQNPENRPRTCVGVE